MGRRSERVSATVAQLRDRAREWERLVVAWVAADEDLAGAEVVATAKRQARTDALVAVLAAGLPINDAVAITGLGRAEVDAAAKAARNRSDR